MNLEGETSSANFNSESYPSGQEIPAHTNGTVDANGIANGVPSTFYNSRRDNNPNFTNQSAGRFPNATNYNNGMGNSYYGAQDWSRQLAPDETLEK